MKKILFIVLFVFIFSIIYSKQIIRISRNDINIIPLKAIDIAGTNPKHGWMDIIVNDNEILQIKNAGMNFTFREFNKPKVSVYMSADSIIDSMIALANNFPLITHLDTIYWSSTFEYPIVCLKISDNVNIDEYDEPAGLFVAMHHSREWQTPGTVLFFMDSLLSAYNSGDSMAIKYINDLELFFIPLLNPEGYMYSRTTDNYWRKTRVYLPNYSVYGVDPNRNYGVSGPSLQSWGTTVNSATSHDPTSDVYCGPHPFTGTEIQTIKDIIINHPNLYLSLSYHSYSELVIYPWGSTTDTTYHNAQLNHFATEMASRLVCRDGTSTYDPGQSVGLYATTGDMTDWAYGYCLYNLGRGHLSFTIEEDITFQPAEADLDTLYRQQYLGFLFSIAYLDSMVYYPDSYIPKPISIIDTISAVFSDSTLIKTTIEWDENTLANSSYFKIKKYTGIHDTIDILNNGDLWNFNGFILDNTHTPLNGVNVLWSDSASNLYTDVRTAFPFIVNENDTIFTFYVKYDIENNYDAAYVEISDNGIYWELIDTNAVFMGTSDWIKKSYIIPEKYRNKSVYFRFRYSTDGGVEYSGVLFDSISCVGTIYDTITLDTLINTLVYLDTLSDTNTYYSATGKNIFGWGIESKIIRTEYSTLASREHNELYNNYFQNEFISLKNLSTKGKIEFIYKLNNQENLSIYDINGRKIKIVSIPSGEGVLSMKFPFASGIYFINYRNKTIKFQYIN